jgi:ABC-type Co2+ transport system permease subunit
MLLGIDWAEVLRRAAKYIIEGCAVALAAYYFPQGRRMKLEDVLFIALTAAATFAILDMYMPAVGGAARTGAGFGVGANLVGFPAGATSIM